MQHFFWHIIVSSFCFKKDSVKIGSTGSEECNFSLRWLLAGTSRSIFWLQSNSHSTNDHFRKLNRSSLKDCWLIIYRMYHEKKYYENLLQSRTVIKKYNDLSSSISNLFLRCVLSNCIWEMNLNFLRAITQIAK